MNAGFVCFACNGAVHPIDDRGVYTCPTRGKEFMSMWFWLRLVQEERGHMPPDGKHCPICGQPLMLRLRSSDCSGVAQWLECPDGCAFAAAGESE